MCRYIIHIYSTDWRFLYVLSCIPLPPFLSLFNLTLAHGLVRVRAVSSCTFARECLTAVALIVYSFRVKLSPIVASKIVIVVVIVIVINPSTIIKESVLWIGVD